MTSPHKLLYAIGVTLLLGTSSLLASQETAQDIAKKAYNFLDTKQNYAFDAIIVNHLGENKNTHTVSVKVDRPHKVRINVTGDLKQRSSYINNGMYTVIDHDYNYYGQLETPKTINGTLDYIFEKFDIKAPLAQLIYSNMAKRVKFKKSNYFGVVDVQGVPCDYIAFADKQKEVHIWIATGDKPLVKHYIIINKNSKDNIKKVTTIIWKDPKKMSASDFVFTAPKNASKISIEPIQ